MSLIIFMILSGFVLMGASAIYYFTREHFIYILSFMFFLGYTGFGFHLLDRYEPSTKELFMDNYNRCVRRDMHSAKPKPNAEEFCYNHALKIKEFLK